MSVETLDVTSAVNVVQDAYGSNKYVLNGIQLIILTLSILWMLEHIKSPEYQRVIL